jgi:hypothetical protein
MSSVIARRVASVPARTSEQTWNVVVELVSEPGSAAREALEAVAGVASMLIAEEYSAGKAIVIQPGSGSRVRIYTLHGEAALGDDVNESTLAVCPTAAAGWAVEIPAGPGDLALAKAAFAKVSGVSAYDATGAASDEDVLDLAGEASVSTAGRKFTINLDEMSR